MGRAFLLLLAGALGGLIAWAFLEPFAPSEVDFEPVRAPVVRPDGSIDPTADFGAPQPDVGAAMRRAESQMASPEQWARFTTLFGVVSGLAIGLLLGLASGFIQGSRGHMLRGAGLGAALGLLGGSLGITLGSALYDALGGNPYANQLDPRQIMARGVGWSLFGLLIGAAEGVVGKSVRRAIQGSMGGLIGGLAGGIAFNLSAFLLGPLSQAINQGASGGAIPRAVGLICIGAFIGLFIGLIEAVAKTAWLRLSLGRNEGKEWVVDAAQTFIGRSESAHVPLFGDPNVAPMHAAIQRHGMGYVLVDGGSPMGTYLNGQRVGQAPLFHGAQIGVGGFVLEFLMKQGSAPARAAEQLRSQAYVAPTPQQAPSATTPMAPGYVPAAAVAGHPAAAVPVGSPILPLSLVAISGPIAGQRFDVRQTLEAGREAAGISLAFDTSASRRHASFVPSAGGVQVVDLGSTNGTFVNDQRVQQATIRPGDLVRIGVTLFRLEA